MHKYKLEIAKGRYETDDLFRKNIILSLDVNTDKTIAEVPAFGSQYTWCVTDRDAAKTRIVLHHFSTAIIPNVDTNVTRLRILKNTGAYKDAYVFIDGTRTLYDMNGMPVWFFPNIEHFPSDNFELRDLKITPQGTITFILGDKAYEVNYNASVLWKAPDIGNSGDGTVSYHHEITRLANGHYMTMGNENVLCKRPAAMDGSFVIMGDDTIKHDLTDISYTRVPFGTVMEYDEKGNLVWLWKSSSYFKGSDIIYHRKANGLPELLPHENAFYFDEKTKTIYVSFRNISRILKVKYPEGNITEAYGETFQKGVPEKGNGLFCHQHSPAISDRGYLYLFNNNVCNAGAPPSIVMFEQPGSGNGALKKVWEYECTIDGIDDSVKKPQYQFLSGGNVIELHDHSIFASMCAPFYSKVFIVSPDKKILWSAAPERRNAVSKKWGMISLYKASMINSREDLERLIWNAEGHK